MGRMLQTVRQIKRDREGSSQKEIIGKGSKRRFGGEGLMERARWGGFDRESSVERAHLRGLGAKVCKNECCQSRSNSEKSKETGQRD